MELFEESIRQKFAEKARNGRITCAECLQLATELGIQTKGIGAMLTEMNIRIEQCKLGCFP